VDAGGHAEGYGLLALVLAVLDLVLAVLVLLGLVLPFFPPCLAPLPLGKAAVIRYTHMQTGMSKSCILLQLIYLPLYILHIITYYNLGNYICI
jgi:hypothetical protein